MKKEEYELLEAQSVPLRNYLMKHVMPTLTQGLIECCKIRPDDAIDYLVSMCIILQHFYNCTNLKCTGLYTYVSTKDEDEIVINIINYSIMIKMCKQIVKITPKQNVFLLHH